VQTHPDVGAGGSLGLPSRTAPASQR